MRQPTTGAKPERQWIPVQRNKSAGLLLLRRGAAFAAGAAALVGNASAATIVVNSLADTTATDGFCTLREALANANSNSDTTGGDCVAGSGADVVNLSALSGTILLGGTQLTISDSVTVQGPGAGSLTIDANNASRVFYIYNNSSTINVTISGLSLTRGQIGAGNGSAISNKGENVTLSNLTVNNSRPTNGVITATSAGALTIQNSTISGNTGGTGAGAIFALAAGSLSISNSTISGNTSIKGAGLMVQNASNPVTITNTTFSGNTATGGKGGGIFLYTIGAAVSISSSSITGNTTANRGGGISLYKLNAALTISDTTISGNTSTAHHGGGISLYKSTAGGTITIQRSTISGNQATGGNDGGAIFLYKSGSAVKLENTTVSGNTANNGGGIDILNPAGGNSLTINSSTIAFNTATSLGGNINGGNSANTIAVNNSIIAGGTAATGPDIRNGSATVNLNYSLLQSTSGATIGGANNLTGVSPGLIALANNGGATQTHLFLSSSPVYNAGDPSGAGLPATDQRGLARISDGRVDMGAVEFQAVAIAPTPPPAPPKISYSAPQAVSENGTTSSVTFTLNGGTPSANVTLPIVSTNTNEVTVSPASVTFAPGGPVRQTVTFTGVDDQVVDGDQAVLIQVGPAVSTDSNYSGYSPGNFVIVNRDNDMALPALPFAGGSLSGFVDITNPGSNTIASIAARAYDKNGVLKGTGTIAQNLPAMGTVSIDMATLQTALGITGVSFNDDARIELLPVGGNISAQGRIKFSGDTINASAANRIGAANLPSSTNADQFTLRITNLSASPQDARATLYSDSGSLLSAPSALLASQLAPRASLDLSASSLQSILGVAPWTGRAQLTMDKGSNFALQMMNVASGMRTMNPMLGIGNGGGTAINYILPPGDATGDSFVRVYNQENFAVPYVGSLYNSSGTLLGSVVLGNASAKGELILTSSQLKSLFGNATWTGPARLVIASDMSSFGAQSTVRHANVLTDVSTVITDNVINHLPDATEGVDIELRIVNPSALTTIVTGTLTNSAGQTVGSANFAIGTLAPNASLMLSRANLAALAGSWSGRATLTLSTNNAVEVLALLRNTTTGAFTNLSERPLR